MVMNAENPHPGHVFDNDVHAGGKIQGVIDVKGNVTQIWSDGVTTWSHDAAKNELTITNATPSEDNKAESNVKTLNGITEGYDVKMKKETDEAWYFICTKSKGNTKKDDPKKMDLVISKSTYLPLSTSIKEKGITITMRDFSIGVTEEEVTFDPSRYADATIIDKR